jgi:hypothetical protein
MTRIATISDDQHLEFREDVHITGNVGQRTVITVLGGFLHIDGNVGDHSKITVTLPTTASTNLAIGRLIRIDDRLLIKGNVGAHTHINTEDMDIIIKGELGPKAILETTSGDITVTDVAEDARLTTTSGDIQAHDLAAGAKLTSTTGDITFHEKDTSATVATAGTITTTKAAAGAGASFFTGADIGHSGAAARGGSGASAAESRSESSDKLTPELETYLTAFADSEPLSALFAGLGISVEPGLLCPISHAIPDKPVILDNTLFDFDSLMRLKIDPSVRARIHPITRRPFFPKDIQPALEKKKEYERIIEAQRALAIKLHG